MLRNRYLFACAACAGLLAIAGCSTDADSLNGAAPAPLPGQTGEGEDLHGDDAEGDQNSPPPNDDPALGGEPDEEEPGGGGTPPVTPSGGSCTVGGLYCGGDKVTGDAKTLYKCNGPGTPTVVEKCAVSCMVNPGQDDSCAAAPGTKVAAPVPGKKVTYAFGVKNPRYAAGYHTGDDYATATGSSAVAVRSGTIRWSNDNGGAYGKWIGLDADNGRTYVYCHLSSRLVASGTKVSAGQLLAKTGATGNVTGPHLHFEDHPKGPFVYGQVRKPAW